MSAPPSSQGPARATPGNVREASSLAPPAAVAGDPTLTNEQSNKGNKTGQSGTGSQGTQEREENITGQVGVQNKQGQTVNPGSTTSPKGGPGWGSQSQGKGQGKGNVQGQEGSSNLGQGRTSGIGGSEESEEE